MDPNMIHVLVRAEVAELEAMTPADRDRAFAALDAAAERDQEIGAIVDEWKNRPWWEHLAAAEVLAWIMCSLPAAEYLGVDRDPSHCVPA